MSGWSEKKNKRNNSAYILYQVVAVVHSLAVYRLDRKKKRCFLFSGLRYDPHLDC